jgi:hypothetical protein
MYERHGDRLLPRRKFFARVLRHGRLAAGIILFSLAIGTFGFHFFDTQDWLDSFVNSTMLLGGMGLVGQLHTYSGKIFASFYALYAGIMFLGAAGLVLAPFVHRILHTMHLGELESEKKD